MSIHITIDSTQPEMNQMNKIAPMPPKQMKTSQPDKILIALLSFWRKAQEANLERLSLKRRNLVPAQIKIRLKETFVTPILPLTMKRRVIYFCHHCLSPKELMKQNSTLIF